MKSLFKNITLFESAMMFAVIHLLFIIIIQIENYILYVSPLNGQGDMLSYLGELGLDNIVFSVFIGALAFFLMSHVLLKIIYFLILVSINSYLVLDQLAFKVFFDHLRLDLLEGSAGLDVLISSALAEVDVAFYINVVFWLISSVLLFCALFYSRLFRIPIFPVSKSALLPMFSLLLSMTFILQSIDNSGATLNQHSLTTLLGNIDEEIPIEMVGGNHGGDNFYQSQYDVVEDSELVKNNIIEVELKVKNNTKKPNIVLIVLESVGSQQLLVDNGLPSREITPLMAKLAGKSVVFDSMYSVYPATVLSHVSMMTGGPAITLGNVYKDLSYHYQGPTLNKGLSALGYQTGFFSSQKLNYGNMAGFYKKLGYDKYFDFGEASEEFQKRHALHSWGGEESAVMNEAISWIDSLEKSDAPFFLQYLSNATHHPYSTPEGFENVDNNDSKLSKYKNSLAYTDKIIKELIQYLKKNDLFDNTVIAIVGDHGEAFGKKHAKNITHKNYLYEENVKNFLLLSVPGLIEKTILSHRIATIGDVMPTLLSFAKAPRIFLPAQNLLSQDYEPRIAYFHKNSPPNLWGLRDGKWKYIDTRLGSKPQLYDLSTDPTESTNLANLHFDKTAKYRQLVSRWYISSNNLFLSRLASYRPVGGELPNEAQLQQPGPKGITMGYQNGNGFVEGKKLLDTQQVSAWISWTSYSKEKMLSLRWQSPSGKVYFKEELSHPGWTDTVSKIPASLPLEAGGWIFSIYDEDSLLISEEFRIH